VIAVPPFDNGAVKVTVADVALATVAADAGRCAGHHVHDERARGGRVAAGALALAAATVKV